MLPNLTRFGWLIVSLLLCILPLATWGADIASDIVPPVASTAAAPWWAGLVMTIVSVVLLPFVKQYLTAHAAAADAAANLHQVDANKSLIDQRGAIMIQLESYLLKRASSIAESEFPRLAELIIAGKLKTVDDVKAVMRGWGATLKDEAIYFFKTQGIDLVATFGVTALDDLIEHAANAVSPFPGKETAVALLKDGIARLLLDKGVQWMKGEALSTPLLAVGSPAPAPAVVVTTVTAPAGNSG